MYKNDFTLSSSESSMYTQLTRKRPAIGSDDEAFEDKITKEVLKRFDAAFDGCVTYQYIKAVQRGDEEKTNQHPKAMKMGVLVNQRGTSTKVRYAQVLNVSENLHTLELCIPDFFPTNRTFTLHESGCLYWTSSITYHLNAPITKCYVASLVQFDVWAEYQRKRCKTAAFQLSKTILPLDLIKKIFTFLFMMD